jgi:hypothetical protein
MSAAAPLYETRSPEKTLLYSVVASELERTALSDNGRKLRPSIRPSGVKPDPPFSHDVLEPDFVGVESVGAHSLEGYRLHSTQFQEDLLDIG